MATDNSVVFLVTKLCEHVLSLNTKRLIREDVKRLRTKFFHTLLFPTTPSIELPTDSYWLKDCTLETQFITWQLHLNFNFGQPAMAVQVKHLYEEIAVLNLDAITIEGILNFLLRLRRAPEIHRTEETCVTASGNRIFTPADFQIGEIADVFNKFSAHRLAPKTTNKFFDPDDFDSGYSLADVSTSDSSTSFSLTSVSLTSFSQASPVGESSGESSPKVHSGPSSPSLNIWNIVSKLNFSGAQKWGWLDDQAPSTERSFFSQKKNKLAQNAVQNAFWRVTRNQSLATTTLTKEEYMRDLKLVVVGIESNTFLRKDYYFVVNPNVRFEGISYQAFSEYSGLLIKCGTCFNVLYDLTNEVTVKDIYNKYGYIYKEFCNAVKRYIHFYHGCTLRFGETETEIIQYHARFHTISKSLFALTALCKVGPYKDRCGNKIPRGIDLLNYLYKYIFGAADRHVFMTLMSMLFSCFQIYFIRFLRPWLFQGSVEDPFMEFFIRENSNVRGYTDRRYWSRRFGIHSELVPEFLYSQVQEILECGRVANLLNLCVPNATISRYFKANKPHLIQFCVTPKHMERVERGLEAYELKMLLGEGSTTFSLYHWLTIKEDEKLLFSKTYAAQRAATIKRIQEQRLEKLAKENIEKQKTYSALREVYNQQLASKQEQRLAELARELKEEEKLLVIREQSNKMVLEEAAKLIAHYERLMKNATVLDEQIGRRLKTTRTICLVEDNSSSASSDYDATELSDVDDEINANSEVVQDVTDANINVPVAPVVNNNSTSEIIIGGEPTPASNNQNGVVLTEAQRNKIKVLRQEYGGTISLQSERLANRLQSMRSQLTFNYGAVNDNADYHKEAATGNDNVKNNNPEQSAGVVDANLNEEEENKENIPMANKPERHGLLQNVAGSSDNISHDNSFMEIWTLPNFELKKPDFSTFEALVCDFDQTDILSNFDFPMRIDYKDQHLVQAEFLDNYIRRSVMVPLRVQTGLVQAALLKYFIVDLNCIDHIDKLRNYYFMMDGDYSRSLTNEVFGYAYSMDADPQKQQEGMDDLVFNLTHAHENWPIRFIMLDLPFSDLGNIEALDGLSFEYYIEWPLNILIPGDAIDKYDLIFQFLMKIQRVLWVLKAIFQDLRLLRKRFQRRVLATPSQYQQVHLYRNEMLHFVQTFQNYIVGEVMQSGWTEFQKELKNITTVEKLYELHAIYVKHIAFLCFLNQKSTPVRKVVLNIFTVILKFYDYLRSREWEKTGTEIIHPNFSKLQGIFENFKQQIEFFFRIGRKVTLSANQPQFVQLMDMLNTNGYYSSCFQDTLTDDEESTFIIIMPEDTTVVLNNSSEERTLVASD